MIREVTMYRVECDQDGCGRSPQDDGDYHAWAEPDGALAEATDGWWFISDEKHLCDEHSPKCECGLRLHGDDEWNGKCEDCADDEPVPAVVPAADPSPQDAR